MTRRSLAPVAHTPVLRQRARHRDKVSAAAALLLSPARGHARLYAQTFPDVHVDAGVYSFFLRHVLRAVRGPLVLVHDRGNMHRGPTMRELCARRAGRLSTRPGACQSCCSSQALSWPLGAAPVSSATFSPPL